MNSMADKSWSKDRHLVHEVTSPVSLSPVQRIGIGFAFDHPLTIIANSKLSKASRMQAERSEDQIVPWLPLIT